MRQTKQGILDLNSTGRNGHKQCRHWFAGPRVITGYRMAVDPDYLDTYEEPIYGFKCMWCSVVREER